MRHVPWLLAITALSFSSALAHADAYTDMAIAKVKAATAPVTVWDGPTTGPKIAQGKRIVYLAADLRNGGILGAAKGVKEAAAAAGWTLTIIDGQGTVAGRTAAMGQALTLKPDGIVVGGFDVKEQKAAFDAAVKAGVVLVGWHTGTHPGPQPENDVFTNVSTSLKDVSDIAAYEAIADSNGKAGVVIFTTSEFAMPIVKSNEMAAAIEKCAGCKILKVVDSPLGEVSQRMPQMTTTLLQKFGAKWTYSLAINDLYYDFMGPSLSSAGIDGDGYLKAISGGDGSSSAFERIRTQQYQVATVPEPLNEQGWQVVDELNRAFNHQPWSGYVGPVHLVTSANIAYDGGPKNVFDPENGYRDHYKAIWGVK